MTTQSEPELAFPTLLRGCVQRRDPALPWRESDITFWAIQELFFAYQLLPANLGSQTMPSSLWFYSLLLRLKLLPEYQMDIYYPPNFTDYIYLILWISSQTATAGRSQRTNSSDWLPPVTIPGAP